MENEELKKRVKELEEENDYIWSLLEEEKNSNGAIGQAIESMLQETIEEQLLKNMKPIGEA